jgi:hypothetical protein
MKNALEKFTEKFTSTLNQKQERALIKKKAATELDVYEITLLRYFVTCAWRDGKKYPVQRSLQTMADNMNMHTAQSHKRRKYAQGKLNMLLNKRLLIPTQQEEEYTVDLAPMQADEWKSNNQVKAKSYRTRNVQEADRQRLLREASKLSRHQVEMLKDFNETIRTDVDNRTPAEVRAAQLPTRWTLSMSDVPFVSAAIPASEEFMEKLKKAEGAFDRKYPMAAVQAA